MSSGFFFLNIFYKSVLAKLFLRREKQIFLNLFYFLVLKTDKQKSVFENTFIILDYQLNYLVFNFKKLFLRSE
jgi:hypothetical protein